MVFGSCRFIERDGIMLQEFMLWRLRYEARQQATYSLFSLVSARQGSLSTTVW